MNQGIFNHYYSCAPIEFREEFPNERNDDVVGKSFFGSMSVILVPRFVNGIFLEACTKWSTSFFSMIEMDRCNQRRNEQDGGRMTTSFTKLDPVGHWREGMTDG